ncbi:hypothetical protein GPJ56_007069 [Histomonas meleagridis]|uniref:uncharacterized protein n=1 Tax=Histomonas meleagridis TaxID=135588 RepID=UPI00355A64FF|nr:hypothetical protein GPJ56_007069 [Histomonas meleagridis]KAH0799782.1 hypothetical protein GO595_007503 [Histomonas meleagridis]
MSNLPPPIEESQQAYDQCPQLMMNPQINPKFQIIPRILTTKTKRKQKQSISVPKAKILPPALDGDFPESNENYTKTLQDSSIIISPTEMGFVPSGFWNSNTETFGNLVNNYFHKKNNSNCRFPHKLYNALTLVDKKPELWPFVGVKWINDTVFKVDKYIFGRLLGITAVDGGLFHSQGNFPSHGFQEISSKTVGDWKDIQHNDIDFDRVRLMTHKAGFKRCADENVITQLKWNNEQK